MQTARGTYIAIFDADFVPEPDFLRRALPHFDAPNVAFVQARWGHVNRDFSWLTRLQAIAIDGHFLVEQAARGRPATGSTSTARPACGPPRRSPMPAGGRPTP
jgi:cellulose synthase/poly-beta-1,6-N-acetylglucosamine synthase-like glycosyltransferase